MTIVLVVVMALLIAPQSAEDDSSLFGMSEPRYGIPGDHTSIREVDFRNLNAYIFWLDGKIDLAVKLKKGKFHREYDLSYTDIELESVQYLPSGDKLSERAVVRYWRVSASGSSIATRHVQVFEWSPAGPILAQQISFGSRGSSTCNLNEKTGELLIRATEPGDPYPYELDVRLLWNGRVFQKKSLRRIPTPI